MQGRINGSRALRNEADLNKVWFIADTHFGHANIIDYCARPFNSVVEMNSTILGNWLDTIGIDDTVFFLGDMAHGRESASPRKYLKRLSGHLVYIRGNHDKGIGPTSINLETLSGPIVGVYDAFDIIYGDSTFELCHNTDSIIRKTDNWVIHGHTHNYAPFLDREQKRICVSVENIAYKPISLAKIITAIKYSQPVWESINNRGR